MKNSMIFKLKEKNKIICVTNRNICGQENFYRKIKRCAELGTDAIMLREKDLTHEEILEMAKKIKNIIEGYGTVLIVNNDLEAALKSGASAFHTSFKKFAIMNESHLALKDIKASGMKIGVSIHNLDEAEESEKMNADYIVAGNIFETDCKKGLKGKGLEFLRQINTKVKIPVIAIGGIGPENIISIFDTGVYGAAVMSCAMNVEDD